MVSGTAGLPGEGGAEKQARAGGGRLGQRRGRRQAPEIAPVSLS